MRTAIGSVPININIDTRRAPADGGWVLLDRRSRFQRNEWCCQTGLNCRPLHYQWSALPLSYGSMPGIDGNRPKWPPTRRPVLATRAPLAQARGQAGKGPKSSKKRRLLLADSFKCGQPSGPVRFPVIRGQPPPPPNHGLALACGGGAGHCGEGRRNPLWCDGSAAVAWCTIKAYSADGRCRAIKARARGRTTRK